MKFFCIFAFALLVACQLTSAGVLDDIKTVAKKAHEVGKHAANSILENSAKVVEAIKEQISEKPSSFNELKEAIKNVASEVAQSSSNIAHEIKDELQKAKSDEDIQKVVAAAKAKLDDAKTGAQERLKSVADKLKESVEYVKNKKNELQENPPTLEEVKQVVKNKINEIVGVSAKVLEKIKNEIEKAKNLDEVQKVIGAAQEYFDKALTVVEGGLKKTGDKLKEIYETIKNKH